MGTDMEISHPVEIFLDTEYHYERQVLLNEAGARRTCKGPLRQLGFSSKIYAV